MLYRVPRNKKTIVSSQGYVLGNKKIIEKYNNFVTDFNSGISKSDLCKKYTVPEDKFESFTKFLVNKGFTLTSSETAQMAGAESDLLSEFNSEKLDVKKILQKDTMNNDLKCFKVPRSRNLIFFSLKLFFILLLLSFVMVAFQNRNKLYSTKFYKSFISGIKLAKASKKENLEDNDEETDEESRKESSEETIYVSIKETPETTASAYYTNNETERLKEKVIPNVVHDFRKTNWGMTKTEVKNIENDKVFLEEGNLLSYKGKVNDLNCLIIYIFAENSLVRARYVFNDNHTNDNDYIGDYNSLKSVLKQKYGAPVDSQQNWKNDLYKDRMLDWGMAIKVGHLSYFSKWNTKSTYIQLYLGGDNYKTSLIIEYKSAKLTYLEDRSTNKQLLEDL